jgi:hypothetical protein
MTNPYATDLRARMPLTCGADLRPTEAAIRFRVGRGAEHA